MNVEAPLSLKSLISRGHYRFCRRMAWTAAKLLTRVRHYNVPDLSALNGGLVIASNHQTYLDPILIGMSWPEPICYLARRSLLRVPGLSALIRSVGTHPISRGAVDLEGLRTVLRLLRRGETLLIFPEGTRTHDGTLGRFKPGVAALARRCQAPILPACVEGAFECWPRSRALPRLGRVAVAFGEPLSPEGQTAAQIMAGVRRQIEEMKAVLAERLHFE
ncbi:MAG: 1-acyl-sn-glycerol-3-phosphate acyltransferase [Planctomycetes bacterium]|nr:1-acyl-sn-glycerol-3-phosphate acyltransferase [Planctomycetota bacterium]